MKIIFLIKITSLFNNILNNIYIYILYIKYRLFKIQK